MLQARWRPYRLDFTFEARTSRGALWHKPTYFIEIFDDENPDLRAVGECNYFAGLSPESREDFEHALDRACSSHLQDIAPYSGLIFGIESALADLRAGASGRLYVSDWSRGVKPMRINGLVWMGDKPTMLARVKEKVNRGFRCIKLKIGGIDFEDELDILASLRRQFDPDELEIRLDANGAFSPMKEGNFACALEKLERLAPYGIHSIEQPIRQGQWEEMARICENSPIPIALDEELIGVTEYDKKVEILREIKPNFIILKPALCGGFCHAAQWIEVAKNQGIGWWATSALESNVGLSAIAQWVAVYNPDIPQGLGTGQLYSNNIPSPIRQEGDGVIFNPDFKCRYSEALF